MEPGAALAKPDPDVEGGFILYTPSQGPHAYQGAIGKATGIPAEKLRVVSTATGGGFGARIACYPEQVVVVALARELGKAVRYIETRSETMLEMQHGRAQVQDVEIGGTRDGKITGLKVRVIADCGAYPADAALMPMLTGLMSTGVYTIPKVDFHFDAVVTNTTPIGAYRGAGRPEATALVERAVDMFAAEIGMDPAEVRRKNFIASDDFPHQTVTGANYDSGAYVEAMEQCLANAGYDELRAEQKARRDRGDVVQLGLGLCSYVEWTGFGAELGTCEVLEDGTAVVTAGTSSHGQGHETAYAQLVTGTLGIPLKDVKVIQSDTKLVKSGMGTMGSRSLQVGGTAVQDATDEVLEKARRLAAHLLEADAGDIEVVPGQGLGVTGSPASAIPWAQLAAAAKDPSRAPEGLDGGLAGGERRSRRRTPRTRSARTSPSSRSTPRPGSRSWSATSPSTTRAASTTSCCSRARSTAASPRAWRRRCSRRSPTTRTATTSPARSRPTRSRAPATCRSFETERTQTPSPRNALGAKGVGESGAIGSTPAVWNAVVDALSPFGVRNIDMPATPQRVWQAISAAG